MEKMRKEENKESKEIREIKETETTASEIIGGLRKENNAIRTGIVCMTIVFSIIGIGMVYLLFHQIQSNERNNQRWLEYLEQYDFVSQDGEELNNYNTGSQGDVSNNEDSEDITK